MESLYAAPDAEDKIYVETAAQEPDRRLCRTACARWCARAVGRARARQWAARPQAAPLSSGWRGIDWPQAMHWTCFFPRPWQPAALEGFWTESDSTQALAGDWLWPVPNCARFAPAEPLAPGAYRLAGPAAQLADRAGNGLADSLLALAFTVGAETAAIRGQVPAEEKGRVRVAAINEDGRTYAEWADEDGRFALNGLLAGTYSVWAFVDRDGDGMHGSGSLSPFRYGEPYGRYGEPVDLDADQIVEGVEIPCR